MQQCAAPSPNLHMLPCTSPLCPQLLAAKYAPKGLVAKQAAAELAAAQAARAAAAGQAAEPGAAAAAGAGAAKPAGARAAGLPPVGTRAALRAAPPPARGGCFVCCLLVCLCMLTARAQTGQACVGRLESLLSELLRHEQINCLVSFIICCLNCLYSFLQAQQQLRVRPQPGAPQAHPVRGVQPILPLPPSCLGHAAQPTAQPACQLMLLALRGPSAPCPAATAGRHRRARLASTWIPGRQGAHRSGPARPRPAPHGPKEPLMRIQDQTRARAALAAHRAPPSCSGSHTRGFGQRAAEQTWRPRSVLLRLPSWGWGTRTGGRQPRGRWASRQPEARQERQARVRGARRKGVQQAALREASVRSSMCAPLWRQAGPLWPLHSRHQWPARRLRSGTRSLPEGRWAAPLHLLRGACRCCGALARLGAAGMAPAHIAVRSQGRGQGRSK